MKNINNLLLIAIIVVFLIATIPMCSADEFVIESGQSTSVFVDPHYYAPAVYSAIAYRTRNFEYIIGGWRGDNHSRFAAISMYHRTKGDYFAELGLGGVRLLEPDTTQLDGNYQFLITVGIGARVDNLFLGLRLRHFSNAGTLGKNRGFEVMPLSVGVTF